VFVGLPVFCLAIIALGQNIQAARSGRGDALSISFPLAVIGLALLDPARDETARTWMLFMPLAVVVASQFFAEAQAQPDRFSWLWGLLTLQVVSMLAVLEVMSVGLYGLPPRVTTDALPSTAKTMSASFAAAASICWDTRCGRRIGRWRSVVLAARNQIDHPYAVFNHPLTRRGRSWRSTIAARRLVSR
jgi:hypothetical protein